MFLLDLEQGRVGLGIGVGEGGGGREFCTTHLYLVRAWTSSVTDKNSAAGVVRVHSFYKWNISKNRTVNLLWKWSEANSAKVWSIFWGQKPSSKTYRKLCSRRLFRSSVAILKSVKLTQRSASALLWLSSEAHWKIRIIRFLCCLPERIQWRTALCLSCWALARLARDHSSR